jgi:digeranylgeranylglycerophospholipid reductase
MLKADVVVVGGGPGGLSAAEAAAQGGLNTVVIEQNSEIGSPIRTSGGSFIKELQALGIPEGLYHPVKRGIFLSPKNSVTFKYDKPSLCIMDVRGVFQFLAQRAVKAGAKIKLNTTALEPIQKDGYAIGVRVKDFWGKELIIESSILIDATGYRASMSKGAGYHSDFNRFGVGAEYDLYAPFYDQDEVILIVGSKIAPAGYAWAFPWGDGRVRVGVGIIHPDSRANPDEYLEKLILRSSAFGFNLDGAQPIEYHFGLIPSDGLCEMFVGNGILAVGDAAGHSSALVGEGIRWAIIAGRMAGEVAVEAISANNYSREFLSRYQKRWRKKHGMNLRIAHEINKRIAGWTDEEWDRGVEILKLLTPDQFAQALGSNFTAGLMLRVLSANPMLIEKGAKWFISRLFTGALST